MLYGGFLLPVGGVVQRLTDEQRQADAQRAAQQQDDNQRMHRFDRQPRAITAEPRCQLALIKAIRRLHPGQPCESHAPRATYLFTHDAMRGIRLWA